MKTKILLISSFFTLFSVVPALAQSPSTVPSTNLIKQYNQDKRELHQKIKTIRSVAKTEKTEDQQARKEIITQSNLDRQAKLRQLRLNQAKILYDRLKNDFAARLAFLTSSKAKLDSKIATKTNPANDLTAINAKLADYAKYYASYQTDLAALDTVFSNLSSSTNRASFIAQINTAANPVRADLNQMQRALTQALRLVVRLK